MHQGDILPALAPNGQDSQALAMLGIGHDPGARCIVVGREVEVQGVFRVPDTGQGLHGDLCILVHGLQDLPARNEDQEEPLDLQVGMWMAQKA